MKMSIFLTSFFSMNRCGSKALTSPAIRVANCVASNLVIGAIPLWPASSAAQFGSVPMPERRHEADARDDDSSSSGHGPYFLLLACASMYSTASFTRVIFSASSSGISMPNSSSNAITSSTVSSESAPRSSNERRVRRHFFFVDTQLLH